MTANIVNKTPYLRTSREFPEDAPELSKTLSKTYIDIASIVNNRTIGIYPTTRSAITGNTYYYSTLKQQSLRQLYSFKSTTVIPIGFKLASISNIIQMYGTYVDATGNTYGLVAGTSVPIAGLITFFIAINGASSVSDNLTFEVGAGAPALVSGSIVLEWITEV